MGKTGHHTLNNWGSHMTFKSYEHNKLAQKHVTCFFTDMWPLKTMCS